MPRKLPWATDGPSTATTTRRSPAPTKKVPRPSPLSDSENELQHKPHQTSIPARSSPAPQRKRRRASRTPSTSPPPAPPSAEFMREGCNADDIYMLVEDEFYAVAQSFTQHLHHAEYVRLKKKARDAPRSTGAMPTTISGMRAETKKKLEAKHLHAKQNTAVKNMLGHGSDYEDGEQDNDPWRGTALAGFMGPSGSQKKTALVGLEKIASSTRAAQGFSRGVGESPRNREEKKGILEMYGPRRRKEEDRAPQIPCFDDEEDDDLDAAPNPPAVSVKPELNPKTAAIPSTSSRSRPLISPPQSRSDSSTELKIKAESNKPPSSFKALPPKRKTFLDDFDDFDPVSDDENILAKTSSAPSKTMTGKAFRKASKIKDEKDQKARLGEMPMFLS